MLKTREGTWWTARDETHKIYREFALGRRLRRLVCDERPTTEIAFGLLHATNLVCPTWYCAADGNWLVGWGATRSCLGLGLLRFSSWRANDDTRGLNINMNGYINVVFLIREPFDSVYLYMIFVYTIFLNVDKSKCIFFVKCCGAFPAWWSMRVRPIFVEAVFRADRANHYTNVMREKRKDKVNTPYLCLFV